MLKLLVENSRDPILNILQSDPQKVFEKPYAGYLLLLFGAADEKIATWFSRSVVALDSLTGDDIACVVFARKVRIFSTQSTGRRGLRGLNVDSRSDDDQVRLEKVNSQYPLASPLVHDGVSVWSGGEREIAAMTYAVDDVARAFGVVDRLPCILVLEAVPDPNSIETKNIGYDVVSLRQDDPGEMIRILRQAIQIFRKNPAFSSQCADLREHDQLRKDLVDKTWAAESAKRQIGATLKKQATNRRHQAGSLNEARRALIGGSKKFFRRHISELAVIDSATRALLTERMDAEYRELGALNKTIESLKWYGSHENFDDLLRLNVRKVLAHAQSLLETAEPLPTFPDPAFCVKLTAQLETIRNNRLSYYEQYLPDEDWIEELYANAATQETEGDRARLGELELELQGVQVEADRVRHRLAQRTELSIISAVRNAIALAKPREYTHFDNAKIFDFFLAYAGPDEDYAKRLYHSLAPHAKVFLAPECLLPGDIWDVEIPNAQKRSRTTVALVSSATFSAYYQSEEIAAAIAQSRGAAPHRVVPIYLPSFSDSSQLPYGLQRTHGLWWKSPDDFIDITSQLLALKSAVHEQDLATRTVVRSSGGLH